MAHSKLYVRLMNSAEWRRLRAEILTAEPLCRECKQRGIVTAARCIHHRIEIDSAKTEAEAQNLAFSKSNCIPLCYECHANIHKAKRSHSREAHTKRQSESLQRWINKHTKQQ